MNIKRDGSEYINLEGNGRLNNKRYKARKEERGNKEQK